MKELIKELQRLKEIELKELKKDKTKGIPLRINPKSYIAKEIEYQTIILKGIAHSLEEVKMLLQKKQHRGDPIGPKGEKGKPCEQCDDYSIRSRKDPITSEEIVELIFAHSSNESERDKFGVK